MRKGRHNGYYRSARRQHQFYGCVTGKTGKGRSAVSNVERNVWEKVRKLMILQQCKYNVFTAHKSSMVLRFKFYKTKKREKKQKALFSPFDHILSWLHEPRCCRMSDPILQFVYILLLLHSYFYLAPQIHVQNQPCHQSQYEIGLLPDSHKHY